MKGNPFEAIADMIDHVDTLRAERDQYRQIIERLRDILEVEEGESIIQCADALMDELCSLRILHAPSWDDLDV